MLNLQAEIGSATFFDLVRDNTTSLDVPQALPYSSGYIVICHLTYKQVPAACMHSSRATPVSDHHMQLP